MSETRLDRLLGGTLSLNQPVAGHRAGTDAVLVAASAPSEPGSAVVDAGSGVGTVGLMLALREPSLLVTLIEREAQLAALARANAALNGVADRVGVLEADLFDAGAFAPLLAGADLVVSNPPFFAPGSMRVSPDPLKAAAHALGPATSPAGHEDWLRAMLRLTQPHGRIVLIQRPDTLPALLSAAKGRLGALRVRPVLPGHGKPAIRILLGGIVGSRAPFSILDPLVLHEADGRFTPLAEALGRGEAYLPLFMTPTRKSRPARAGFQ